MKGLWVLLWVINLTGQKEYLVKIDFEQRESIYNLAENGVPFYHDFHNFALSILNSDQIGILEKFNVKYEILDENPEEKIYYIVWFPDKIIEKIYQFGDVLFIESNYALLRFEKEPDISFFSQKWEVIKFNDKPVNIKREKEYKRIEIYRNPIIEEILSKVSSDSITSYIQRLQNFRTRYATTDSARAAANWIKNKFLSWGYDSVYLHYFSTTYAPNVVCTKVGYLNPEEIYIIGAHFDCTSQQPTTNAPGADDNGSGTACVLEAARVLKDYEFEATVKFIAFSAEEQGLIGSNYYASQAHANGDSIVGMLNFDMIGYDENTDIFEIHSNSASQWLANYMAECVDTYIVGLSYQIVIPGSSASDHASFWNYGYHAIMGHENIFNPYYHSTQDLLIYLDPSYYTSITKAGIATLASLSRPRPLGVPQIPTVISPFNFAKLPVKNPLFKLITIDPQNDDVIYRIYWAKDTLFTNPDSATTPPYPSGEVAQYPLPVFLEHGETYWFKVKARDTTGSGYWSQYTNKFSITIDTTMPSNTCSWFQTKGAQFAYNQFNGTQIQGDSVLLLPFGYFIDTLLFENFESGIPSNWTVIDGNNDGYKWTAGTTPDLGSYTPPNYGTKYAYYSDDDAGNGVINTYEAIISPSTYVPSNAQNLKIQYGYGFRVYQSGERYEFGVRFFKNGSWGSWINLKTYTSSGNGTENFDLSSNLPCDSVQLRWYYHDENSSSHWGWACGLDNVILSYAYAFQNNEGIMITAPCNYHNLSLTYPRTNWGYIYWEKATPEDSIGIQVEYYNGSSWQLIPDSHLPGNSTGFFTQEKIGHIEITNLDTIIYNTIRLRVLFYRKQTENPDDPSLLSLEIGNPLISISEKSPFPLRPYFILYPTIFRDNLFIKYFLPPFTRAKIEIYSITGRIIRKISYSSEDLPVSGFFIWNGTDEKGKKVSTGIYFIKMESKDIKKIVKTVYIK